MFEPTLGFVAGAVLAALCFLIVGGLLSVISPHADPGYVQVVRPSYERP